jgi:DNA-directed RNA polymerase subunit RPC12/RpoP
MFCMKCGAQLPDDAVFCMKCGASQTQGAAPSRASYSNASDGSTGHDILAPSGVASLKCPNCGAPISPKFGEMVITCEYCGSGVTLGGQGWRSIQKQTMLPLKLADEQAVMQKIHEVMDKGFFHRHLQESSTLEEVTLSVIPYWVIPASARTSIVATDMAVEVGSLATTAALIGVMGASMGGGGRRGGGGFAGPLLAGAVLGSTMGGGNRGGQVKTYQMDENYNFPVVAIKALSDYQPKNYQFRLEDRTLFDMTKVPKGVKVLNGDIGEDVASYQAKTLVDQLQSDKAHAKYHMIQKMQTDIDVGEGELLHVPIWFARYEHKGGKIVLIFDGNSGEPISTMGI